MLGQSFFAKDVYLTSFSFSFFSFSSSEKYIFVFTLWYKFIVFYVCLINLSLYYEFLFFTLHRDLFFLGNCSFGQVFNIANMKQEFTLMSKCHTSGNIEQKQADSILFATPKNYKLKKLFLITSLTSRLCQIIMVYDNGNKTS